MPSLPELPQLTMPGPAPVGVSLAAIVAAVLVGRSIWMRTAQMRAIWAHRREAKKQHQAQGSTASADTYRLKLLLLLRTLLSPADATAEGALHELKKRGNAIDWHAIIPDKLPAAASEALLKILRQLGGTSFVAEARNALAMAEKILSDNGATWRGAAEL
ncbi:MAG: hypothetical protein JO004_10835 [Methylobacteriaceae bacterium]|nr:hypothetical protein [Methylobacteriaceae bacterium]